MKDTNQFEIIIIGGSYAGLSAALALGRSLRKVLVIDSGKPCNRQTPHSHNFLTQDGKTPKEIATVGREQIANYKTVEFYQGLAVEGVKTAHGFAITTHENKTFVAKKLIFATGVRDIMPDIDGFAECWGISVIHCPYCHGYEVRNEKTAILGNGDYGFEFSQLIHNWTKSLTLFTNGKSTLTNEQSSLLQKKDIEIYEGEIDRFEHLNGKLEHIVFKDGCEMSLKAIYARVPFVQNSDIPTKLGCELTDDGLLQIDSFQRTSVDGIYACGDSTIWMRSVANAVATGANAGAFLNKDLIKEAFYQN